MRVRRRAGAVCLLAALYGMSPAGSRAQTAADEAFLAADAAYQARTEGNPEDAARLLHHAVHSAKQPERRRRWALDLAYLRLSLDCPAQAVAAFETALAVAEDGPVLSALGYARLAAGDERGAIAAFERALRYRPADGRLLGQLGYLHQGRGERPAAARYFRTALGAAGQSFTAIERERLRREVRNLERRSWGGMTVFWRDDGRNGTAAPVTARALSRSQGLAEANLRLGALGSGQGRWIAAFSRLLWQLEDAAPTPSDESLQAGIGLKIKPFASETLIVAAERLMSIGAFARNDWLFRLSYSAGTGLEAPPAGRSWPVAHVYADFAAIDPADPDLQFNAETRLGWGFSIGPAALAPHLLAASFVQQDALGTDSLLEAGPAMSLRLPLGGTPQRAARLALELQLGYRFKLAGSAANPDGPTLALSLRF